MNKLFQYGYYGQQSGYSRSGFVVNLFVEDGFTELLSRASLDSPACRELRRVAYRAGLPF